MIERYKYSDDEIKKLMQSMTIIVDSQEKKNQHIISFFDRNKIPYVKRALDFGDYSFFIPTNAELSIDRDLSFEKEIAFERKNSAEEISGCFTQTRQRFENEFIRAGNARKYLLIENTSYEKIAKGDYNTKYNSKAFLASIHSFETRYDIHVVYMPDNSFSAMYIYWTFQYYLRNLIK